MPEDADGSSFGRADNASVQLCDCRSYHIAGSRSIYSASTTLAVLLTSMDVNDRP